MHAAGSKALRIACWLPGMLAAIVIAACAGPAPQTVTVVETVIVEKEVEGETVTVVETVEVVKEVEVEVEKEKGFESKHDIETYGLAPFVVGIWEFQLNHLDRELAELFEEYAPTLLGTLGGVEPAGPLVEEHRQQGKVAFQRQVEPFGPQVLAYCSGATPYGFCHRAKLSESRNGSADSAPGAPETY